MKCIFSSEKNVAVAAGRRAGGRAGGRVRKVRCEC